MHISRAWLPLLAIVAVAVSGCLSPKASLAELGAEPADQEALQQALRGAARPNVPVIAAEPEPDPVDAAPPVIEPDPAEPLPDNETKAPDRIENRTDQATPSEPAGDDEALDGNSTTPPADNSTAPPAEPEPPRQDPCEDRIVVDNSKQVFYWKSHAGTMNRDQTGRAEYRILSNDVVASGIAVGLADSNDFCHLEDAYPCVWQDPIPKRDEDPRAETDAWRQYFGFTNVWTGLEDGRVNEHDYKFTTLQLRGWARLSDGTLVLDSAPNVAMWGEIEEVKAETSKNGREADTSHMCDLVEAGILPPP